MNREASTSCDRLEGWVIGKLEMYVCQRSALGVERAHAEVRWSCMERHWNNEAGRRLGAEQWGRLVSSGGCSLGR